MGLENECLLNHSEIRWLSKGQVFEEYVLCRRNF